VARRAKQSTIGIYRHFAGKSGLLDALFVQGFERLGEAARKAGERERDARAAVMAAVDEYLALARRQPQHYRLMFNRQTTGYAPSGEARDAALSNYASFVELVGRLPGLQAEARRIAADLFALVHGHVALRAQDFGPDATPEEWAARIMLSVERQLDMLAKRG
jgi:AcrR family transcriptional regulator